MKTLKLLHTSSAGGTKSHSVKKTKNKNMSEVYLKLFQVIKSNDFLPK